MAQLTKAETAWLIKLQAVIDECPSKRLAAYTTGDSYITLYDGSEEKAIQAYGEEHPNEEHGGCVKALGAELANVKFPFQVHSTAG